MRKILFVAIIVVAEVFGPPVARSDQAEKPAKVVGRSDPAQLASILTVLNVPARGIACGLSGLLGSVVMLASGGARYPLAAEIMEEGCSGPWIVTPQMVQESRLPRPEIDDGVLLVEQRSSEMPPVEHVTSSVREPDSLSSLDAVRRGEAPSTPASSPLGEIYFEFDRYDLRPDARQILDAHANWLEANASVRVEIEGHCDDRGGNEYNMALAAKRAHATRNYLADHGIAADRLSTISYGEELPVCREHVEECWQRNRRVRFVIIPARPPS